MFKLFTKKKTDRKNVDLNQGLSIQQGNPDYFWFDFKKHKKLHASFSLPLKNRKASGQYIISYCNLDNHDFILLSKTDKNLKTKIIESSGFYPIIPRAKGKGLRKFYLKVNYYIKQALFRLDLFTGFRQMGGKLRDEDYILNKLERKNKSFLEISFNISKEQAILAKQFIEENRQKNTLPFNVRDLNCKKFAVTTLRHIGIKDKIIENHTFPHGTLEDKKIPYKKVETYSTYGYHVNRFWQTKPNIIEPTIYKLNDYPSSYLAKMQGLSVVDGAIGLLEDYCCANSLLNRFFHPKRHHIATVRECLSHIKMNANLFVDINSIVNHISNKIAFPNPTGSLSKRLDFLLLFEQHLCREKTIVAAPHP